MPPNSNESSSSSTSTASTSSSISIPSPPSRSRTNSRSPSNLHPKSRSRSRSTPPKPNAKKHTNTNANANTNDPSAPPLTPETGTFYPLQRQHSNLLPSFPHLKITSNNVLTRMTTPASSSSLSGSGSGGESGTLGGSSNGGSGSNVGGSSGGGGSSSWGSSSWGSSVFNYSVRARRNDDWLRVWMFTPFYDCAMSRSRSRSRNGENEGYYDDDDGMFGLFNINHGGNGGGSSSLLVGEESNMSSGGDVIQWDSANVNQLSNTHAHVPQVRQAQTIANANVKMNYAKYANISGNSLALSTPEQLSSSSKSLRPSLGLPNTNINHTTSHAPKNQRFSLVRKQRLLRHHGAYGNNAHNGNNTNGSSGVGVGVGVGVGGSNVSGNQNQNQNGSTLDLTSSNSPLSSQYKTQMIHAPIFAFLLFISSVVITIHSLHLNREYHERSEPNQGGGVSECVHRSFSLSISSYLSLCMEDTNINIHLGASPAILRESGGLTKHLLVHDSQYYLLFTSLFTYAGLLHLAIHMLIYIHIGVGIEKVYGTLFTVSLYVVSGVFGNIVSMLLTPASGVYVSTGNTAGLYAFLVVCIGDVVSNWNRHYLPRLRMFLLLAITLVTVILTMGPNTGDNITMVTSAFVSTIFYIATKKKNVKHKLISYSKKKCCSFKHTFKSSLRYIRKFTTYSCIPLITIILFFMLIDSDTSSSSSSFLDNLSRVNSNTMFRSCVPFPFNCDASVGFFDSGEDGGCMWDCNTCFHEFVAVDLLVDDDDDDDDDNMWNRTVKLTCPIFSIDDDDDSNDDGKVNELEIIVKGENITVLDEVYKVELCLAYCPNAYL